MLGLFTWSCQQMNEPSPANLPKQLSENRKEKSGEMETSATSKAALLARIAASVNQGLLDSEDFRNYLIEEGKPSGPDQVIVYASHQMDVLADGQHLASYLKELYQQLFPEEPNPFETATITEDFPFLSLRAPLIFLEAPDAWDDTKVFASIISHASFAEPNHIRLSREEMQSQYPDILAQLDLYQSQHQTITIRDDVLAPYTIIEDDIVLSVSYQPGLSTGYGYDGLSEETNIANTYIQPKSPEAGLEEGVYHFTAKAYPDGNIETKVFQEDQVLESRIHQGSAQQAFIPQGVDIPLNCNGVQDCDSPALLSFRAYLQQLADDTCLPRFFCTYCCLGGYSPAWVSYWFEPQITCTRSYPYEVLLSVD
ncbi:MAG: hypothetical protein AAFU64_04875 [Bacteroidota bacterium]